MRSEINEVVALSTTGSGVSGASVQINHRDGTPAVVWTDETGNVALPNPLVTIGGRITGWLDDGSYVLEITAPVGVLPAPFAPQSVNMEVVNGDATVAHRQATTNVHGIPDTSLLVTQDMLATNVAGAVTLAPATSARNVIQPTADVVPLTVKGFAAGADLLQAQGSTGALVARIDAAGVLRAKNYETNMIGAEAFSRLVIDPAQGVLFGNGNTTRDTLLSRTSPGQLQVGYVGSASSAMLLVAGNPAGQASDLARFNAAGTVARVQGDGTVMATSFNAASSGTGMVLEQFAVRRSTAGARLSFGTGGATGIDLDYQSSGANYPIGLRVNASQAGNIPLVAKGVAAQTADLFQAQDSAGGRAFSVSPSGVPTAASYYSTVSTGSGFRHYKAGGGSPDLEISGADILMGPGTAAADTRIVRGGIGTLQFQPTGPATVAKYIFRTAASQISNNLLDVQDSGGATMTRVGTGGRHDSLQGYRVYTSMADANATMDLTNSLSFGAGGASAVDVTLSRPSAGNLQVQATGVDTKFIVKGVAGQAQNLQEWQNSAGTALAKVNAAGNLTANYLTAPFLDADATGPYLQMQGGKPMFIARAATSTPLAVRGAASQTANLQEWQDSAGALLARVTSGGMGIFGANVVGGQTGGPPANYTHYFNNSATGSVVLTAKGATGQTADIFQAQDNASSVLASITAGGFLRSRLVSVDVGGGSTAEAIGDGAVRVIPRGTTATGIAVRGNASQTGDLQQWQDSTGAVMASISSGGAFSTNSSVSAASGSLTLTNPAGRGLLVKGAASQTANLQEWQASTGTLLTKVDSGGSLSVTNFSGTATVDGTGLHVNRSAGYFDNSFVGGFSAFRMSSVAALDLTAGQINSDGSWVLGGNQAATVTPLAVKARGGQTADLQQWRDSTGAAKVAIENGGRILGWSRIFATTDTASGVPFTARGVASQTGNLQEWQDSSAVAIATVSNNGIFYTTGGFQGTNYRGVNGIIRMTLGSASPGATFPADAATTIPLVIKGAASQTANLQEWQDSTGTAVAKVRGDGSIGLAALSADVASRANIDIASLQFGPGSAALDTKLSRTSVGTLLMQGIGPATNSAFVVRMVAAQTGNPFEIQTSAGSYKFKVDANGYMTTATGGRFIAGGAATTPLIAQGFAGQTATLQEWQNSAGTALASINSGGYISSQGGFSNGTFIAQAGSAAMVPLLAVGRASQTANLQEWQDSAGSPLFAFTAAGRPRWNAASLVQNTVGAAGAAAALPATPSKYLQVVGDDGVTYVVPAYAAA